MVFQGFSRACHGHHLLTRLGILGLIGLTLILTACGGSSSTNGSGTSTGQSCPSTKSLTGAGSTFINPLFSKMFTEYPSAKCGADVNYQSVGSGAGINDLLQNIVQFGATDAPMTDAQLAKSTNGTIIHIPATIGAVAISYNLAGVSGHLNLTGPVVADIYLGTIKFWDLVRPSTGPLALVAKAMQESPRRSNQPQDLSATTSWRTCSPTAFSMLP